MTIIENLWIVITIVIILFVLSTDPKTPSSGGSGSNQANIISSVSEGQKSVRTIIWVLISCFYVLSLLISYY